MRVKIVKEVCLHIVLSILGFLTLVPFFWMVSTSLKKIGEVFVIPPIWIPKDPQWHNFIDSLRALPFGTAYINSTKITLFVLIIALITSSMAAFALARIKFDGAKLIFPLILLVMMVPGQVTMIPLFFIINKIGWTNTHWALMIPGAISCPFGVFLLRQFCLGIPKSLEEAAIIDGCNYGQIFIRIILPLLKAPLSALGIFLFMWNWNSFMGPLIYLNDPKLYTVPLLLNLFKGLFITDWTKMMAATCIAIIPVLVTYIMGQKYIIEGVTLTGIK